MKRKKVTVPAAARRAGAAVGGLLCAMVVAALASTNTLEPGSAGQAGAAADDVRTVPVAAGETGLVCPAPAQLEQPEVGDDEFSAAPVATTTSLTAAVLDGAEGAEPSVTTLDGAQAAELTGPLASGDVAAVLEGAPPGARMLRVTPGGATYATATVASVTTDGDLRGMVAGPCAQPAVEHWLVGGSTSVGSSGRLVLQNPGRTPATVTLEAWGASGPVALGSQSLVVVPPGEQVVTMLEAIAPDQNRLTLHVTAEGGRVGAYIQHHRIDGLVPMGADLVVAGSAPSRATAVSGVVSTGEAVDDPHAPRLDLLAPGAEAGTARLAVLGPDGPVRLRGGEEVDLEPGQVATLPLGGLPEGTYTVIVDADVPVVAGAALDRVGTAAEDAVVDDDPYDRAWLTGQAMSPAGFVADGAVAIPPDAAYGITLSGVPDARDPDQIEDAAGSTEVTLRGVGPDGEEAWTRTVDVPTGETVEVAWADLAELDHTVAVVTEQPADEAGVVWSVRLAQISDTTLFSVLAPTAPLAAGGDVRVSRVDAAG
ncbi:DUF5719 family protein [Promicromonospora soli]|uniref:Secreted protein n=1 Tax=Promicromonospora soli TaxID=2035533 RepID=A0A919G1D5_9MICO|nr:DUF5719 family protein [Promicromonospora soli]GHH75769.1 hypothetical protein GCM10017772_32590 [Promicromonospora soli]